MKISGPDSFSDSEYIRFVLEGRKQYFQPLAERYWAKTSSVIRRYVFDAETVKDLCQETFFRAFTKLHLFDQNRSFLPWLLKIAVNIAIEHLRKNGRTVQSFSLDEGFSPEDKINIEDLVSHKILFEECLQKLNDNYKVLFALRHGLKLSYEDISFVLNESPGTVKSALFRIRNILKTSLSHGSPNLSENKVFEDEK
jgi:RNA polymerase sigma-70 factor (ECF subfamily)